MRGKGDAALGAQTRLQKQGQRHLYRCTGTPRMRYQPRPKRVSSRAVSSFAPRVGSRNSTLVICCDHPDMRLIWVLQQFGHDRTFS